MLEKYIDFFKFNFDPRKSWKENEEVNVANVTKQMLINAKSVGKVMPIIVRKIIEKNWTKSRESLLDLVKTATMEC